MVKFPCIRASVYDTTEGPQILYVLFKDEHTGLVLDSTQPLRYKPGVEYDDFRSASSWRWTSLAMPAWFPSYAQRLTDELKNQGVDARHLIFGYFLTSALERWGGNTKNERLILSQIVKVRQDRHDEQLVKHIHEHGLGLGEETLPPLRLPEERSEQLFNEAVQGLQEFHPELKDQKVIHALQSKVKVPNTGNDQLDYENIKTQIEQALDV